MQNQISIQDINF